MPHRAPRVIRFLRSFVGQTNSTDVSVLDVLLRAQSDLDQKASSTLTFIGLLLAAVSILLVGGGEVTGRFQILFYFGLGLIFTAAFSAALLCLSCFNFRGPEEDMDSSFDEVLEGMARAAISRKKRFVFALRLTFGSAVAFIPVVFLYLARAMGLG